MKRSRAIQLGKAKDIYFRRLVTDRDYARLLTAKLKDLFPIESVRLRALDLLQRYGVDDSEPEVDRVRLGVLRLSGNDLEKIESTIRGAKEDYQDIINWAEHPATMRAYHEKVAWTPEFKNKLQQEDAQFYEKWLNEHCKTSA